MRRRRPGGARVGAGEVMRGSGLAATEIVLRARLADGIELRMTTRRRGLPGDAWLRRGGGVLALAVLCASLTGCLVAGYSSRGGAFFWPGGLGGILLLVLLFLFLRGRR